MDFVNLCGTGSNSLFAYLPSLTGVLSPHFTSDWRDCDCDCDDDCDCDGDCDGYCRYYYCSLSLYILHERTFHRNISKAPSLKQWRKQ